MAIETRLSCERLVGRTHVLLVERGLSADLAEVTPIDRRTFLRGAGAFGLLSLAGCRMGVTERPAGTEPPAPAQSTTSIAPAPTTTVPVTTSSTMTAPPTTLGVTAPVTEIPNIDPIKWAEPDIQRIYRPCVESLYQWNPDGTAEPVLAAEPWDMSRDRLVYTVPLREGIEFHDGSTLDAETVVAGFRAVLDPANASQWTPRLQGSLLDVEASGRSTVVFRLARPFSPFETLLGLVPIMSATQPYRPQLTYGRALTGTGPFRLEWVDETTFRYIRFDAHHTGTGTVDEVLLSLVHPDDAADRLAAGEAQLAAAVEPDWPGPRPTPAADSTIRYRIICNLDPGRVTSSFPFRSALWSAVDRAGIVRDVLQGQGAPAFTTVGPGTIHARDPETPLRAAASIPPEPGDGLLRVAVVNDPTVRAVAEAVRTALSDLGYASRLTIVSGTAIADMLRIGEPDVFGDFDLMVARSFSQPLTAFNPDYAYFGLRSGLVTNISKVSDPELDRLLDEAIAAGPEDRPARWAAVQRHDAEAVLAEIPLAVGRYAEATSLSADYAPSPYGSLASLALL